MKSFSNETKHLLYWQKEWAKRFFLTWYHILNRKAYNRWKTRKIRGFTTNLIIFDDIA